MNGLVSVIIPTYGGSIYLRRCIDSILAQTYRNIEIIVIDDNGEGTENQINTAAVMGEYSNDSRVRYMCHKMNKNGSAARNTGVKNASGEYIALMDDDDEFYPQKITRQVNLLNSLPPTVGLVYCACDVYLGEKKVAETHAERSGRLLYECLMHKVQIASSSILIRKSVYEDVGGFDESFRRHQDWEFVDRVASRYLIQGDDFIGFRRNLEFRNKLGTPEVYKERRLFYLEKMMPLITTLSKKEQKDVLVRNRMDIVLSYLKHHRFKEAFREYLSATPGWRGVSFFAGRLFTILIRGKVRIA